MTIMGDVTYGGCCVDDFAARELGADFLIHYAHSCLVPIGRTDSITCLYVFVDIQFDALHLYQSVLAAFDVSTCLALVSIVQFVSSLQQLAEQLRVAGYQVSFFQF